MSEPIVQFDHVYKKFARGERHTTLRDAIPAMLAQLRPSRRRELAALRKEEFWAVQDVSFSLKKGEALGIIGPNGSGKSTILKLLSGILRPERGTYRVQGRLSSLIEVGAGFHPDLTGRENVYLNGCIMGMTRKEITRRFNEIVAFAGVEEFIDTPLKHYSSGMAVRLGFATSAFIEPEVLLVDEVLAVGDTEFRNRCQARMEAMRNKGVTMILVSHNLNEVRNLCERTLMLFKGKVAMEGPSQKVLEKYHQTVSDKIQQDREKEARPVMAKTRPAVQITAAQLLDEEGTPRETFVTGCELTLRVFYNARKMIGRPRVEVELTWAAEDWSAAVFANHLENVELGPLHGEGWIDLQIGPLLLEPNVYAFNVRIGDEETATHDTLNHVRFVVSEAVPIPGVFGLPHRWSMGKTEARGLKAAV